jgi:hypothetical protein
MVLSTGSRSSQPPRPAMLRNSGKSCASSIAGSLNVNHHYMKWMRSSSDPTAHRGRPRLASGVYVAICSAKSDHGTARFILMSSRRRDRFVKVLIQVCAAS